MARKKAAKPSSEELEAQADAILQRGEEHLLAELKRHGEILEQMQRELVRPRNDPEYLKALEARDTTRSEIANAVKTIHIVPDKGKTWIGIGLTNPRHHADALETARKLGQHFEAELIRHDDPEKVGQP